jgi:hypothetical protein
MPNGGCAVKESRVLTGYVFGGILALGGLLVAVFADRSRVSHVGVSGALDMPLWLLGALVCVFGVVVIWRSIRLQRQK